MSSENLRETLEELREELGSARSVDPASRELLTEVVEEIQELLEREESGDEPLLERLREAIGQFETTHPQLTAAANRVASALANLGI